MSVGAVNKNTGDRIPTAGMPAIDDALDLTSVNPVQNAIVTAALANKQDKTDNNLDTTAKTIVGAINEHEGDIGSLKSGLTNLNNNLIDVDVALSVPKNSGKNLIPLSLDNFKTYNTDGTWSSNVYSENGIDFTVNTDASGAVTSISASGTASATAMIELRMDVKKGAYTLNGCPSGGSAGYYLQIYKSGVIDVKDRGDGAAVNLASDTNVRVGLAVGVGLEVTDLTFYPMLRLANVSDPTFAPYIPSVESRIEAVESGLTNLYFGNPTSVTENIISCGADDTDSTTLQSSGWYRCIVVNNGNVESSLRVNNTAFMYLAQSGREELIIPLAQGTLLLAGVTGNGSVTVNKYNF